MRLSTAEHFLILRRRLGKSQSSFAHIYGWSRKHYVEFERGHIPPPKNMHKFETLVLTKAEKCLLIRRRYGFTQAEVARRIGCSRMWVGRMERGTAPCDRLWEFLKTG